MRAKTIRHSLQLGILCVATIGCRTENIRTSTLKVPAVDPASQTADPALAVIPGSGDLVLSWAEGYGESWTLYVARSSDQGARWSAPVKVAGGAEAPGEIHPHGESSPRLVAASAERLALVWPNSIPVSGRKWPATLMRFARSADGGKTWSRPVTLNDDTTGVPVSHQFHGAAWTGDSGLSVAWLDEREIPLSTGENAERTPSMSEPDATIYVTTSSNFGLTWSPNRSAWKAACPCCRVSLAREPSGRTIASWRKHYPGNVRDVVLSPLSDPPPHPRRIFPDDWSYPGCPHTGPALAIGADGMRHVVWYNGKQGMTGVYYARTAAYSSSGRVGLVTGRRVGTAHPAVAPLEGGGALAGYDINAEGKQEITVARISEAGSLSGQLSIPRSDGGKYPQLTVLDDTTGIVAWTTTEQGKSRIRLVRLRWR